MAKKELDVDAEADEEWAMGFTPESNSEEREQ